MIEAVRDEATTGTTGSPDIVSTLFSKIEECDLFIADISLCYTGDKNTHKRSPNPNVLLELGFALKTLGTERVICICNSDFGTDYPFDIAHNRITDYSLERGGTRKEVRSDVSRVIFTNIRDLRGMPPKAKANMATHIIGTYDFNKKKVKSVLVPVDIRESESYILHNKELLYEAKELISEIAEISKKIKEEIDKREKEDKEDTPLDSSKETIIIADEVNSPKTEIYRAFEDQFIFSDTKAVWENEEEDKLRIKQWLGIEVTDDFFSFGELKQEAKIFNQGKPVLKGTDAEKEKYHKVGALSLKLLLLEIRTNYIKTFDGLYYIPLAIQNISTIKDEDIRIVVSTLTGEIIDPDDQLVFEEYEEIPWIICRDDNDDKDVGLIAELFLLNEDENIKIEYETDFRPYHPPDSLPGLYGRKKDGEDYKEELEEFIANSMGSGYCEFNVKSLRPRECRWFSQGLLIKPVEGKVKLKYQIHSAHSTGDLSGELELE